MCRRARSPGCRLRCGERWSLTQNAQTLAVVHRPDAHYHLEVVGGLEKIIGEIGRGAAGVRTCVSPADSDALKIDSSLAASTAKDGASNADDL